MGVGRKSSGTVMAYDPAERWTARAWALLAYLVVLAAVAGIVLFALRYQPLSAANFASGSVTSSDSNDGAGRICRTAGRSPSVSSS